MLTQKQLDNLKPKAKEYALAHRDGLYVRVRPSGSMSWVYRYRWNGKPDKVTLGAYNQKKPQSGLTLKQAAGKASKLANIQEQGFNPKRWLAGQAADANRVRPTLAEVIKEFEQNIIDKRMRPDRPKEYLANLSSRVGKLYADEIKRRDILPLLDEVTKRKHSVTGRKGAPTTANRMLSLFKQLFKYAAQREYIESNPLAGLTSDVVGGREKPRERSLTVNELRQVLAGMERIETHEQNRLFVRFLLGSAQRIGAVAGMKWTQVDFDQAEWWIPASDAENFTKSDNGRTLPLPMYLLDLLKKQARMSGDTPYVWPALKGDQNKPFNYQSINMMIRTNQHFGIEHFSPHDLRRTAATQMADQGVDAMIIERVLGHKLGGVLAIYNKGEYHPRQREALEILGDVILSCEADNVVPMSERR